MVLLPPTLSAQPLLQDMMEDENDLSFGEEEGELLSE